jgi:hypothetical protein
MDDDPIMRILEREPVRLTKSLDSMDSGQKLTRDGAGKDTTPQTIEEEGAARDSIYDALVRHRERRATGRS